MVPYFGKCGAKQLFCIPGNQLSLANSAVGTGKAVEILCSIPSVPKNTCYTVKICPRFYFLRCAKPGCSEPPGTPAKLGTFVYILIVLKNTISNRQCYVSRQAN